jgi:hypothetical protein
MIALGRIGPAAIVIGVLVIGLQLQRLIEVGNGGVVLAFARVGIAAIVVGA